MATTTSPAVGREACELRDLRKATGLTQNQVAALAQCSRAFIANVEQGYVPRHSPTLDRILDLLNSEGAATNGASAKTDGDGAVGNAIAA